MDKKSEAKPTANTNMNIRITEELLAKIKAKADEKGCSVSAAVKILLTKWVNGEEVTL